MSWLEYAITEKEERGYHNVERALLTMKKEAQYRRKKLNEKKPRLYYACVYLAARKEKDNELSKKLEVEYRELYNESISKIATRLYKTGLI